MQENVSSAILVVDNERSTRALLRSVLNDLGYPDVAEAADGERALRVLSERPVQLIISDFEMSKLDGLGLLRAVRCDPKTKAIPFLLVTARADIALLNTAKELGINGCLLKPFSLNQIREKVKAVINGQPR